MDKINKLHAPAYGQIGKNNQSEFDFIKDKPELIYLVKKLERLASAIHMVTNFLSEIEPLRISLREECLLALKNVLLRERAMGFISVENNILHCVSLLNIGKGSVIISDMNAELLKKEFLGLLPVIGNMYINERERLSFNASELNLESAPDSEAGVSHEPLKDILFSKGHKGIGDVLYETSILKDKIKDKKNLKSLKQAEKVDSTRSRMILDILKNRGEVGIKDITSLMKGVSSKTIQRDLGTLVSNGVLKKLGKRRWSRYLLVG